MTKTQFVVQKMIRYSVFLIGVFFCLFFNFHIYDAESSASDNVSGFAWSDNIGWISMNSGNTGNYGVTVAADGTISGYAWSDNIGWVSFNASDVSACPSGSCSPHMDTSTGIVTGWAKALSGGGANAGGWDGFISLSGATYGVKVKNCTWNGWAWGSSVVGWVNFNGRGGTVTGTGSACVALNDPDLITGSLTVPAVVKAGSTITLSDVVTNDSAVSTITSFSDEFTYSFNNSNPSTWNAMPGGVVSHTGGIGANASFTDTVGFTLPSGTTGDLYIRYCVDSKNDINEKLNETNNCDISSKIQVIDGTLTASPYPNVMSGNTATLTWNTTNTTGLTCDVTGALPATLQGQTGSGQTIQLTLSSYTYVLACNSVPLRTVTLNVNSDPELTVSSHIVAKNDPVTLTVDVKGQLGCTLVGGSLNQINVINGLQQVTISGRTTFTLTCPTTGSDSETVEVASSQFET